MHHDKRLVRKSEKGLSSKVTFRIGLTQLKIKFVRQINYDGGEELSCVLLNYDTV